MPFSAGRGAGKTPFCAMRGNSALLCQEEEHALLCQEGQGKTPFCARKRSVLLCHDGGKARPLEPEGRGKRRPLVPGEGEGRRPFGGRGRRPAP